MYSSIYKPNTNLRIIVLVFVILNLLFNYVYPYLGFNLHTQEDMSAKYYNLFQPAPYTFSIWGLIYLSFIIYSIFQLLPSQQYYSVYDRIGVFFILINLLCSVWLYLYLSDNITAALITIYIHLLIGAIAFVKMKRAYLYENYSGWILVPFSLFLGWICVAAIANTVVYLEYTGFNGNFFDKNMWVMILIGLAGFIGVVLGLTQRNFMIPLVISWACIGIWYARRNDYENIAKVALGVAIFNVVISLIAMVLKKNNKVVMKRAEQEFIETQIVE